MRYSLLVGLLATGAQLLPAAAALHLLLPTDRRCAGCGGETLLLRPGPLAYACSLLVFGRVRRRWCPACGREELVRAPLPPPLHGAAVVPPLHPTDLPPRP